MSKFSKSDKVQLIADFFAEQGKRLTNLKTATVPRLDEIIKEHKINLKEQMDKREAQIAKENEERKEKTRQHEAEKKAKEEARLKMWGSITEAQQMIICEKIAQHENELNQKDYERGIALTDRLERDSTNAGKRVVREGPTVLRINGIIVQNGWGEPTKDTKEEWFGKMPRAIDNMGMTFAESIIADIEQMITENAVVPEPVVCEYCGASDKSVGLATGDNGLEMWVCRFCDVDGSNYNGWGDGEPKWGDVIATMMARTEFAVYVEDEEEEDDKCSECGLDDDDCECDVCYGKHCDKKSCLKLATGWNRSRELDGQRFALNLYCDDCIEQDCFEKCEACRVVYPVTSLNYRTGGLFGEHCGNNLYCEACCKDIEEKMTLREEPEPAVAKPSTTYTIYASEDGNDYNAEIYCYGDLKQALNAFNGEKKRKASKKYLYKKLKLQDDKTEKEVKVWQRTKEEIVRPTFQLAELNTFNFDYTLFKHERGGFCKYAVYNNTANHYVACDFDGDKIIGWGEGTIYKTLNAWTTANWKEQRIKDGNNKTTRNNAYRETKYIPLQIIDDDELIYGPLYEEIEWESSMSIEKK